MPGLLGEYAKGLLGFVSDPQSWRDMGTNAVGLLGAPLPSKQEALAMALRRRMHGSVMRDYPSAETDLANSYREKMQNVALGMNPVLATVWHGSPHKFDKFDISKIGTGEGAQAYGHGLYFAESPEVARGYRGNLSTSDVILDGKNIGPVQTLLQGPSQAGNTGAVIPGARGTAKNPALNSLSQAEREAIGFIGADKSIDDAIAGLREQAAQSWRSEGARKLWAQRADTLESLRNRVQVQEGGALYKVDLPDDQIARMLDWDKPLSQQPEAVQTGVKNALVERGISGSVADYIVKNRSGRDALSTIGRGEYDARLLPPDGAAAAQTSLLLQKHGVPGIRYLDGGSRGAGAGTSNYVVFSDKIPKILSRE